MEYAKLDGAEFAFGYAIQEITPEGPLFKIAQFDENDKVVGYEPEPVLVQADATILAVSQAPKNRLLLTTEGLEANDRGLLVTDEICMTTVKGVFAAGDVVHGSHTVVDAANEARLAAQAMMRYMEA